MGSYAFALPVKDAQRGHKLIEELVGDKSSKHHEGAQMHGITRMKIWQQTSPVDMVIVYVEGPDAAGSMTRAAASDSDFSTWLDQALAEVTGHQIRKVHSDGKGSKLLLDYHHEKGHSTKEHG